MRRVGVNGGYERFSGKGAFDPLAGFKRRTYTLLLSVGLAGSAFAWVTNELADTVSGFTRFVFLTVVGVVAVALWALRAGRLSVRFLEEGVYLSIGSVLLGVLAYALYFEPDPALVNVSLFSLHLWFPFLYIFVFLAYDRSGALVRAGALYALSVLISLPAFLLPAADGSPLEGVNTLGLAYLSEASIVAVLYFLTGMKDDLRRTELNAERMKRLADTDPLTGILNRRGLEPILEREIENAARDGGPLSLIVFDLDDFKALNDTYGHDSGDRALVNVARAVQAHLGEDDHFSRWGGEEFAVLTPGADLEAAYRLADRLRNVVWEREPVTGWRLSASFGVSAYRSRDSGTALSKRADVALYRAKELGKNRTEKSA